MIALPHLVFLTVLFAAGFTAWLLDFGRWDFGTQVAGSIVAGLGAGLFIGRFGTAMVAGLMAATVWAWLVRRRRATAAGGVS